MNTFAVLNLITPTVVVAFFALIISFLQFKIANLKIKLDLYDKQFRVFQSVLDYAYAKHDNDKLDEIEKKFELAYRESKYLFKINDQLPLKIIAIRDIKHEIFEYLNRELVASERLYNQEKVEFEKENFLKNQKLIRFLINDFDVNMSKYVEFRNIGGFDAWSIYTKKSKEIKGLPTSLQS